MSALITAIVTEFLRVDLWTWCLIFSGLCFLQGTGI